MPAMIDGSGTAGWHGGRCRLVAAIVLLTATSPAGRAAEHPGVPLEAPAGAAIRVAVIGDYGLDAWKPKSNPDDGGQPHSRRNPHQAAVADLVASWRPDFVVTTGDNNYPKGEAATIDANIGKYYAAFIGNYRGSHGPGAAVNRFFPVPGNHDWDAPGGRCQPYTDYFTLPGNERYYDFVWGPLHFIMLDTDLREPDGVRPGSRQYRWYRERAAASESAFQVVVGHHPPYSSGRHGGSRDADWGFHEHGIDLVLSGHDHDYERLERGGAVYVVNGAGGAALRPFEAAVPGSRARHAAGHGAVVIDVSPVADSPAAWRLAGRFVAVDGTEIDSFTIERTAPAAEVEGPAAAKTATFSIVAADPEAGLVGAAVASKYPAVAKVVPFVRAGVGAFCTQHHHRPPLGPKALELLEGGMPPAAVLEALLAGDPQREQRQLAIIDAAGRAANLNPAAAPADSRWWGGMTGRHYACQGNTLAGRDVVVAMARAYEETPGTLADRLVAALAAGDRAGGDHRGRLAAGVRVAKRGVEGHWLELDVDESDDAVEELVTRYRGLRHEAKGPAADPAPR